MLKNKTIDLLSYLDKDTKLDILSDYSIKLQTKCIITNNNHISL